MEDEVQREDGRQTQGGGPEHGPKKTGIGSPDTRLNHLLETVVTELKLYAFDQISQIKRLTNIGIALSAEKEINRLLEMIVNEARNITGAEAGVLYIVDPDEKVLRFEILQNDTTGARMGGTSGVPLDFPPVPLLHDGMPDRGNVPVYVALTGQTVNIPEVRECAGFSFNTPLDSDPAAGFRAGSMLVLPMKNFENEILGVLQLFNATNPETGGVVAFSEDYVDLLASLASQAAVAFTNAQLIQGLKDLFYSFIRSIATAIDAKSPYTGGHIRRVVDLTVMLAQRINSADAGPFAGLSFSEDELEELRLAAWMHDIGKIATPEHVVDKRTRLETIYDRIELIQTRFDLIRQVVRLDHARRKLALLETGRASGTDPAAADEQMEAALDVLREEQAFITQCNLPGEFVGPEKIARIEEISRKSYEIDGVRHPYLTPDEAANLSIPRGTLTDAERQIIQDHAEMTMKILEVLPFPRRYARVPQFASSHHEKLDGSGYPRALREEQLPVQARIMAIADIFEALTARDRPYKAPMTLSHAMKILDIMKKNRHIDPDLMQLFVESGLPLLYAEKELSPEQIDDKGSNPRS